MSGAGKIALVTGAGSGVGRAAALALLADGYTVVLAGRREEALAETSRSPAPTARTRSRSGRRHRSRLGRRPVRGDRHKFGRLDVLFNNAGGNTPTTNFGDLTWSSSGAR